MLKRLANLLLMALGVFVLGLAESGCTSEEPAAHLDWMTSLPSALGKAKAEHKLVLLVFTGSDWCAPCRQMHDRVLETQRFKDYADTNLVPVQLDFPQRKPQPAELKQANEALQKQFDVPGYPTVILLDDTGKVVSKQVGYDGESAKSFIAQLQAAGKGS